MSVADDKNGSLLLVLEPVAGEDPTAGGSLLDEGTRIAAQMGVETRLVTWEAQPDPDLEALAALLAQAAERMRPAAVLLADSDTARRLAPKLGGRNIGGRWLLDRHAVAEHLQGATAQNGTTR